MELPREVLPFYNHDIFAKTAVSVMYDAVYEDASYDKLFATRDILLKKHPHNLVVQNALNYLLYKLPPNNMSKEVKKRKEDIIKQLNDAERTIGKAGAKKIRPGMQVFVHSLNNHVVTILHEAAQHKDFTVNILEHSPLGLGHALKKHIDATVHVYLDLAMHHAIYESDLCFIGANGVDKGAYVKIGSNAAADYAKEHHIPVYVCHNAWKVHPQSSSVLATEHDHDYDFQRVHEYLAPEKISAHICEFGIFKPQYLVKEVFLHHPWRKAYH